MKRIMILIGRWALPFLITLSFALFIISSVDRIISQEASNYLQAIMQTATDGMANYGPQLYLNFTLKILLVWAAVRIYVASFGLRWDHLWIRAMMRGHTVIVCFWSDGVSSEKSSNQSDIELAIDFASSSPDCKSVVLVTNSIGDDQRQRLWNKGVKVLVFNKDLSNLVRAAAIQRASTLIATCEKTDENIAVCRISLSEETDNKGLQCKCKISTLSEKRRFKVDDYFEESMLPRVRIFNNSELLARRLFNSFPPDRRVAPSAERVHLLLIGLGSIGQAVLERMARMGHYRSGLLPKLTIVDRQVAEKWQRLETELPALKRWVEWELIELEVGDVGEQTLNDWMSADEPFTGAYICLKNEIVNLRISRILVNSQFNAHESNEGRQFDVVALDPPGGLVLSEFFQRGRHSGLFHKFSLTTVDDESKRSVLSEGLSADIDDSKARALHNSYFEQDLQRARENPDYKIGPNSKPWEQLPENIRDANRMVTDHFDIKMRAIGCEVIRTDSDSETELDESEIELLAKMEHRRWWADRDFNGWFFGATRDDVRKIHPNMVPYSDLSEPDKQKDRDSVQNMVQILKDDGFLITRKN